MAVVMTRMGMRMNVRVGVITLDSSLGGMIVVLVGVRVHPRTILRAGMVGCSKTEGARERKKQGFGVS
jgi:hypothetical protein